MKRAIYKLVLKWKSLSLPFKILIILVFLLIMSGSAYFLTSYLLNKDDTMGLVRSNLNKEVELIAPSPIPPRFSPINGIQISAENYDELMSRHPVSVVINNHKEARPQSGLSFADIVLEVLAEGGITRYVAVYHSNYDVEKIGPVRSLRYYMIDFAGGFDDSIILHHGWAGHDGASFEVYNEKSDARGAISRFGVKNIQTDASTYRDPVKVRTAGSVHALYTDFSRIRAEIDRLGKASNWKLGATGAESPLFKDEALFEDRGEFGAVNIKFMSLGGRDYEPRFTYDRLTNTYPRFIGGNPDVDTLTEKQIAPKNVAIEWHNYADARDGHNRIVIEMIGEDKVTILRDGEVIEGVWKKECRTCRTKYFDELGNEIPLNRGQLWVVNAVKVQDRLISTIVIE